ncbi:MAG: tRNA (N6-threonylcarbamoyladenosine(37)-N6)-methyltransferase TrmO [Clostridia bacterium]|nr:tRNA (N6-threonylcarbamoyladenosine(37)-N6)-methyltransferase TrmO [Clostridia bacterium]
MKADITLLPIAHIRTDFPTKFGVPRQSGIVQTEAKIVFLPEYRNPDALRGLEDFSHLWLIWHFSCNDTSEKFCPTVRPPRLGGNKKVGVFATRSPFRPNPLGLSCVEIKKIEHSTEQGPVIHVVGADLVDSTPIYDIKPYIPYTDSRPDALGGFSEDVRHYRLEVNIDEKTLNIFPEEKREALLEILAGDPRPSYHTDPERIYGFPFAGHEIKFTVADGLLSVKEIIKI